jgi:hypothetical protein
MKKDPSSPNYDVTKKMIRRFLTEKRILATGRWLCCPRIIEPMTKEELAKVLGTSSSNIDKLNSPEGDHAVITEKLSDALRRLYFVTKWELGMDYKETKVEKKNS